MVQADITAGHPAGVEGSISHRAGRVASITTVESDIEVTIGARSGGA